MADDSCCDSLWENDLSSLRGIRTSASSDSQSEQAQHLDGPVSRANRNSPSSASNSPRAFAATPPGFRSRTQTRNNSDTYEPSREEHCAHGRPVQRDCEWSTVKAKLPHMPPVAEQKHIKAACFDSFITKLRKTKGDWSDKVALLASEFEQLAPAAGVEAELATRDLDRWDSTAFNCTSPACSDDMHEQVDVGNGNNFTAAERQEIRWCKFALSADARQIDTQDFQLDTTSFPSTRVCTAFVRAATSQAGSLINQATKNRLNTNARTLVQMHCAQGEPWEPATKSSSDAAADPEKFVEEFEKLKMKTRHEAMVQIIKTACARGQEGVESLTQRILKIKQSQHDPRRERMSWRSVTEATQDFEAHIQEVDTRNPPTDFPDLEATSYQALSPQTQEELVNHLHANGPTSIINNIARFNELRTQALKTERSNRKTCQIAARAANIPSRGPSRTNTRNRRVNFEGPNTSTTFCNAPAPQGTQSEQTETHVPDPCASGTYFCMPTTFVARQQCCDCKESGCMDEKQEAAECMTFLSATASQFQDMTRDETPFAGVSAAEEALRNASGTKRPIKCFGCEGMHDDCMHLWKDCPRKRDQQAWKNFLKNLGEFRKRKADRQSQDTSRCGPTDRAQGNWSKEGCPSKEVKNSIAMINEPTTTPDIRRTLLTALAKELGERQESEEEDSKPAAKNKGKEEENRMVLRKRKSKSKDKDGKSWVFLLCMHEEEAKRGKKRPIAMLAQEPLKRFPFKIAFELPHMTMPIGTGETEREKGKIKGLLDTGGCCMMAKLEWMTALMKECPQFFHKLAELEQERHEVINIGGLKDGTWITHIVEVCMPHCDQNGTIKVQIGLSNELPVDVLIGANFQQKAKFQIDLGNNRACSPVFQDHFPIVWERPHNKEIASLTEIANQRNRVFVNQREQESDE